MSHRLFYFAYLAYFAIFVYGDVALIMEGMMRKDEARALIEEYFSAYDTHCIYILPFKEWLVRTGRVSSLRDATRLWSDTSRALKKGSCRLERRKLGYWVLVGISKKPKTAPKKPRPKRPKQIGWYFCPTLAAKLEELRRRHGSTPFDPNLLPMRCDCRSTRCQSRPPVLQVCLDNGFLTWVRNSVRFIVPQQTEQQAAQLTA